MNFDGVQTLTLLDYPEQVACTLFTGGCNFRCPFCHNASLVMYPESVWEGDAVLAFLKKRQGVLDGVCVTGGEPLLQKELPAFLELVKNMGYKVKLDTNGAFPEKLAELVGAQLVDYVAMDVKNSPQLYAKTIGLDTYDLKDVEKSVDFLLGDNVQYEFRTTVVREFHQDESFHAIGKWIGGAKKYFLQAFSDNDNLICSNLSGYNAIEMEQFRQIALAYVPNTQLRGV